MVHHAHQQVAGLVLTGGEAHQRRPQDRPGRQIEGAPDLRRDLPLELRVVLGRAELAEIHDGEADRRGRGGGLPTGGGPHRGRRPPGRGAGWTTCTGRPSDTVNVVLRIWCRRTISAMQRSSTSGLIGPNSGKIAGMLYAGLLGWSWSTNHSRSCPNDRGEGPPEARAESLG